MWNSRIFGALLVSLVIYSPSIYAGEWVRVSDDIIRFSGVLDKDSYVQYLEVSEGGYKELHISSPGGSPYPALMIALDAQRKRVDVHVDGVCLSACANYLALAGKSLHVSCKSILGWHGSPANFDILEEDMKKEGMPDALIVEYSKWLEEYKRIEYEFLQNAGVKLSIFSDSVSIVDKAGIIPDAEYTFDPMTGDYAISTTAGLWIPTVEVLEGYGVKTRNFCRAYDKNIDSNVRVLGIGVPYTTGGALN